jgi:anti-sigma factor RsiW
MSKYQNTCDPMRLSRLWDHELEPDEAIRIREHVSSCPSCQKRYREHQLVSNVFRAGMNNVMSQIRFDSLENKIWERIRERQAPWQSSVRLFFSSRKFLIPVAAIAAMLFVFFSLTVRTPAPVVGPSALITSFTGDISSVMFLETPESHQTIIWFQETF